MTTFLKIIGLIFLALIAIKLAPIVLVPVFLLGIGIVVAGVLLAAGLTASFVAMVVVIAALSPIWIPVALLVGLIALICLMTRGPRTA